MQRGMKDAASRAVRVGETLDVVLGLDEGAGAFAQAGPRVDGDGRLAALAYAPGLALLARVRFGGDGVLDAGTLATRLAALPTPGALIEALAPALAVAEMDRAHGGLVLAAFDTDEPGGLVDAHGFAEVPSGPREALVRGWCRSSTGACTGETPPRAGPGGRGGWCSWTAMGSRSASTPPGGRRPSGVRGSLRSRRCASPMRLVRDRPSDSRCLRAATPSVSTWTRSAHSSPHPRCVGSSSKDVRAISGTRRSRTASTPPPSAPSCDPRLPPSPPPFTRGAEP